VLSGANLISANLQWAKLVGANLLGADLSQANLQGADLRDARLTDCLLKGSNLARSDLTGADLTGAVLDGADLSAWVVRKATCARLLRSESGEVITFSPGEFEIACFQPEKIVELTLPVPLSVSAAYIAKFITESINTASGTAAVALKGIEAASGYQTKVRFVNFHGDSRERELSLIEEKINDYFVTHPLKKDELYFGEMLSGASSEAIDFSSCRAVLQASWQINPKVLEKEIVEEYAELVQICKALHPLIFAVFESEHPTPGTARSSCI
jgi:hypothetical protein